MIFFLVICENTNQALGQNRAGSADVAVCTPQTSFWLFAFFRNLVSDKQDSLAQCADFRTSLPSQEAMLCSGPLAVIQGRTSKYALATSVSSACSSGFCHVIYSHA